jgi:hypothetical protein
MMKRVPTYVILGFTLGLLAPCLQILAGLPAIYFSFYGLRQVYQSDGQLGGERLAQAGLILGGLGTLISLVGFGLVLAMPWFARARQAESMNRLRLIGEALGAYSQNDDRLPAATRDPEKLPPPERLSWMADLLPHLQLGTRQQTRWIDLAAQLDRSAGWEARANESVLNTPVLVFQCPSHPDYTPNQRPAPTHYVAMAGVGARAAYLAREDRDAGAFGHDRPVRLAEVQRGISHTLAVLETAHDNGPWLAGDRPTVRGMPAADDLLGRDKPFGGMHRGLTILLFLDGSARLFHNDTAGAVLRQQSRLRE